MTESALVRGRERRAVVVLRRQYTQVAKHDRALHARVVPRILQERDDVDAVAGVERAGEHLIGGTGDLQRPLVALELRPDALLLRQREPVEGHLLTPVDRLGEVEALEKRRIRHCLGRRVLPCNRLLVEAARDRAAGRPDGEVLRRHVDRHALVAGGSVAPCRGHVDDRQQDGSGRKHAGEHDVPDSIVDRHSTRSVVSLLNRPCFTGTPNMLISYG